ncbi:MAG: winged helix DNA-binding protein [Lachnospiraceae bacterium]|nr:winged helix DNA-binding protein [Lachnospiraceae bacterium]
MLSDNYAVTGMQFRKLLDRETAPIMKKYDLRMVELEILMLLHRSRECTTARDIVAYKHMSKAHISKSIDNMKERGFVIVKEDEADRRRQQIVLTEKSQDALREMIAVHDACVRKVIQGIPSEKLRIAQEVVAEIARNIDKELQEQENKKRGRKC